MGKTIGKIGVFGDSSCLEIKNKNCLFILDYFLDFLENDMKSISKFKIISSYSDNELDYNEENYLEDLYLTNNSTFY